MPTLRPARDDDYPLYRRLFAELGVDDPPVDENRWRRELLFSAYVVDDDAGRPAGYALVTLLDDAGYLRQLVIDPHRRRSGLGRFAMEALAGVFCNAGCRTWCLNVKPDNQPAMALYRAFGMSERHRSLSLRLPWSALDDAPGASIRCDEPTTGELSSVESEWGMPSGMIASWLAPEAVVVRVARRETAESSESLGLAVFDPVVPGCFPFRATSIEVALALLRSLRSFARPDDAHLQVIVEDAPLIAVELEQVGAWRVLEFAHLSGPLPPPSRG